MDKDKERKERVMKFVKERFANIRASHKTTLEQERTKTEIIKRLLPAIENLYDNHGIDVGYRWGGLTLDSNQPAIKDYDGSWKIAEAIFDAFVLTELDVQIKKTFNGFRTDPSWDWHIIVKKQAKDKTYLSLSISWAEPSTDCTPIKQANVSSYWTCQMQ